MQKPAGSAGLESIVPPMFRPARLVAACSLALIALLAVVATPAGAQGDAGRRVVLVVWSAPVAANYSLAGLEKGQEPHDVFLRSLAAQPGLSIGLLSTVQGDYSEEQALLDISQGTRQPSSLYSPRAPYAQHLDPATASFADWARTVKRAHDV
jgi:hypothetical protein